MGKVYFRLQKLRKSTVGMTLRRGWLALVGMNGAGALSHEAKGKDHELLRPQTERRGKGDDVAEDSRDRNGDGFILDTGNPAVSLTNLLDPSS